LRWKTLCLGSRFYTMCPFMCPIIWRRRKTRKRPPPSVMVPTSITCWSKTAGGCGIGNRLVLRLV